jgi:transcriptional regulator with XRE-family HTH domain
MFAWTQNSWGSIPLNRHRRKHPELSLDDQTARILNAIGHKVRSLRKQHGLTLQALADASSVSASMLSLVERGLAAPSIESLILIGDALSTSLSDLFDVGDQDGGIVVRADEAKIIVTEDSVIQRVLRDDSTQGVTIAIDEYSPGLSWQSKMDRPAGVTHGLVIEGELTVEVDGRRYALHPGDLISYASDRQSRVTNRSGRLTRTVWFRTD